MHFLRVLALGALALVVGACGSSSSSSNNSDPNPNYNTDPAPVGLVRVVHAVADAPAVNVTTDRGSNLASGAGYKAVTALRRAATGNLAVSVDAILPGGATATVIGPATINVQEDVATTVIATGSVAAGTLGAIVVNTNEGPVGSNAVRATVVHAAAGAPAVDIFITAPGADLATSTPIAGGATPFGAASPQLTVTPGDYQIRVTLPGDLNPVFDSGTVALPGNAVLLVMAVDYVGPGDVNSPNPGAAPINLLVSDGTNSFEIFDVDTPTGVRVVHAVPDAPGVDIYVDDAEAAGAPAVTNLEFPDVVSPYGYVQLPAGAHDVMVTVTGNPGAIAIPNTTLDLAAGTGYTVYASGELATIAPFITVNDNRRVATEARLRVLHMAPNAPEVDLYVMAPGTDINDATPAFTDVPFLADTGYVALPGGSYDVAVTLAGTKTVAIGPLNGLVLSDGGVYTVAARDPNPAVAGDTFGVILMDDFAAALP